MGELLRRLMEYADSDCLPMHMPGHKRRMGEMGNPYFIDLTEIEGFDDLHCARGILQEAQKRAAELYHSEETHYLVNGSTAGILAAVSGCSSFGGKILMARNCHKSAFHGARLMGLHVEYIYPQFLEKMGINGAVLAEDVDYLLKRYPDIQCVLITSPTYDGVVSEVGKIAETVHRYGIPLIVDEAHGAHFPFSDHFPMDSVSAGADVVIHSLHKTLPSLTQTALIHLNGRRIDPFRERIRDYLSVYQTSSPSYVLMASMDSCMDLVRESGEEFERFHERIQRLRERLRAMECLKLLEVPGMDESRILVSAAGTGWSGQQLSKALRLEYRIELEMACSTYVCAITTVADTEKALVRFGDAFLNLDRKLSVNRHAYGRQESGSDHRCRMAGAFRTRSVYTLLEAGERDQERVPVKEASGRICGEFVIPYPPGIPLLAPGELVTEHMTEALCLYINDGSEVYGVREGQIAVIKNQ